MRAWVRNTFQGEQAVFHGQAAAKATDRAVTGDDSMARDDNGNWIRAASRADGARRSRFANLLYNPTVGARFTTRDRLQGVPDRLLEVGAGGEVDGNSPVDGSAGG